MWRNLAFALALVSIPLATNVASAQPGEGWGPPDGAGGGKHQMHGYGMDGMGGGMGGPGFFLRGVPTEGPLAEKLALTGAQRDKLNEIKDRAKREMISLQADLKIAHLDLEKAIRTDAKTSELDSAVGKVSTAHAAFLKSRVHTIAEERSILTPAQRKVLEEFKPERQRNSK